MENGDRPNQTPSMKDADASAARDPRVGTLVGSYRLIRVLGQGGMGVVYLAEHQRIAQIRVAIKLLLTDWRRPCVLPVL